METLDYLPSHPELKLYQDHSTICINTDTMVLGEFLEVYHKDTVLDIGTNNGALLLYASLFHPKKMTGLEINPSAVALAKKNMALNHIDNADIVEGDAVTYQSDPVDVILCNPPYFKKDNGSRNATEEMTNAKHEELLPLEDLVKSIARNLKENGKLFFIYQSSRLQEVLELFSTYHLAIKQMVPVYHVNKEISNVTLIKAVKNGKSGMKLEKPLYIKDMKVVKL